MQIPVLPSPVTSAKMVGSTVSVATGCRDQAADDRPGQRGCLLAAFAPTQSHRHHAGHHGATRHEDRPQAALRTFDGRRVRRAPLLAAVRLGEA